MRWQILSQIDFNADDPTSGCRGCRFARICRGGCPAEAVANDWRHKSRFCLMYRETYSFIEKRLSGMMPHVRTVPDWTTNDEARMMQLVRQAQPDVSPFNAMSPQWSRRPSTWRGEALRQKGRED
jgi:hypothetical protein